MLPVGGVTSVVRPQIYFLWDLSHAATSFVHATLVEGKRQNRCWIFLLLEHCVIASLLLAVFFVPLLAPDSFSVLVKAIFEKDVLSGLNLCLDLFIRF